MKQSLEINANNDDLVNQISNMLQILGIETPTKMIGELTSKDKIVKIT